MGEAGIGRHWPLLWVLGTAFACTPAAAQSRFLSYETEKQCLAGHVLTAPRCRSAFANARGEFDAKAPSFSSLALCAKSYGACDPWPPGSKATSRFRPRWSGVDIVDTPTDRSVTPTMGPGLKRLSFVPQPLTEFRNLDVRGGRFLARTASRHGAGRFNSGSTAVAASLPGSGFTLKDGVLTFPAPARFQPKNLPQP